MADLALIAGAGGFIGRRLAQHLLASGMEVCGLDLKPLDLPGCRTIRLDLTDRGQVLDILSGLKPRWVFNLTGAVDHTVQWPEQREIINQHWLSVLNLVEALSDHPLEAFVNIGSSDEYGDQPAPQHEELREKPIAPYSAAKTAAAHYLQMCYRRMGFPAITARLFLVFGPGQDMQRLIPTACASLLRGERFPASPALQKRDFLFVEDAVKGLASLPGTPGAAGKVFNLASGKPVTVREVLETLHSIIQRGSIDFGARPLRPGEIMELYADITQIKQVTGWRPTTTLAEGLCRTVEYYKRWA